MTNKKKAANNRNTEKQQTSPDHESLKIWLGFLGVIIAGIIGGMFTFWGIQTQVYGPIHATETDKAYYLTQTTLTPISTPTLISTSGLTSPPTETITPYPEPKINVSAPTKGDLDLLPIIYVDYLDLNLPGTQTYRATVSNKAAYLWTYVWCTRYSGTLNDNLTQTNFSFFIDNIQIPESKLLIFQEPANKDGWKVCQRWTTMLSGWSDLQSVTLSVVHNVPMPITDGYYTYHPGEYRHDIIVIIN